MPTLTDPRNDQDEKNPGQQHYDDTFNEMMRHPDNQDLGRGRNNDAFDSMMNHPDNQALNNRLDSVAANPDKPLSTSEMKNGEQSPGFSYSGGKGGDASKTNSSGSLLQRAKSSGGLKKTLMGGGIGAAILGMSLSFLSLLPLKIVGLMDSVTNKFQERAEQVVERRAALILARAMLGSKIGDNVVPNGGILKTLVSTLQVNKFEETLARDYNIKLEANEDGTARLVKVDDNKTIKTGLTNEKDLLSAIESGENIDKQLMQKLLKDRYGIMRVIKRHKMLKLLRIKYKITKSQDVKEKVDPEKSAEENAFDNKAARDMENATNQIGDQLSAVEQAMGGTTAEEDGTTSYLEGEDATDTRVPVTPDTSGMGEVKNSVMNDLKEQLSSLKPSELRSRFAARVASVLAKHVSEKITQQIVEKVMARTGGFLVIVQLENILYNAGSIAKLPSLYKAQQYAKLYYAWQTYADQIKAGHMSAELAGEFSKQLDGYVPAKDENSDDFLADPDGAEASQTFNYISGNPTLGKAMSEEQKVNEKEASSIEAFQNGYRNAGGEVIHTLLAPVRGVQDIAGDFLGWISDKLNISDLLEELGKPVINFVIKILGLNVISPLDNGAKLYNGLGAGADVSYNAFCKDGLGCRELSNEQASVISRQIAAERIKTEKSKSIASRLFDTNNTNSFVTQLAMNLPSSVSLSSNSTVNQFASFIGGTPSRLLSTLTSSASAAEDFGYKNLYGVTPYGATAADLDQDIADQVINGGTCGTDQELANRDTTQFNVCMADMNTTESLICAIKNDLKDKECMGGDTATGSSGSISAANAPSVPPGTFIFPVKQSDAGTLNVSSCYGWRNVRGGTPWHPALDVGTSKKQGVPAYASGAGQVVTAGPNSGYGNFVAIKHQEGLFTHYAHLASITVKVGDTVTAGQQVGIIGNTGGDFATHLDFGFSTDGRGSTNPDAGTTLNPLRFVSIPPDIPNSFGCSVDKEDYR